MLTIQKIESSDEAVKYYAEYAQEKGESEGHYHDPSRSLGVHGQRLDAKDMENLLRGFSPDGKSRLCRNAGKDHQPGWDLTFSAPKSVSVVWANAPPKLRLQIEAAHERALKASLDFLNTKAGMVRTGRGGTTTERATLVFGLFQHSSNRAEQPQLHTHAILFNAAKTISDGKWRTLQPRPIYRAYMAAGAMYRADLAHSLEQLGFALERTPKAGFRLSCVPLEVAIAQSSRSREIEELLAEQGLTRDTASAQLKKLLAVRTRQEKGHERITRDFERWQTENAGHGFGPKDQAASLREERQRPTPVTGSEREQLAAQTLQALTEQASTFSTYDLHRRIAEASIGRDGIDGVLETVKAAEAAKNTLAVGRGVAGEDRYTTQELYAVEREILSIIEARRGEGRHVLSKANVEQAIAARATIKEEQAAALRQIALGKDGVAFIEGDAGTGKSYLMAAVREVYEKQGYVLQGLSFTNKAAQGLEKSSGIRSESVDRFLMRHRGGHLSLSDRTIVVLDEAAMLDSRKTHELLRVCAAAKAKVVAIGDEKQIQPILAGQAFGTAKRTFGASRLAEIVRQQIPWERDAIRDLAEGRTVEALKAFDQGDRKQLRILPDRNATRRAIVAEWFTEAKRDLRKAPLMVVTTNTEVAKLNVMSRQRLLDDRLIAKGHELDTAHGTLAFSPGETIIFTGNYRPKRILNSTFARIEKINPETLTLTVITETGHRIKFNPKTMNHFRHGYAVTAHKSQGSTVDRALVMVDGYNMDREKLYVSMSRGRAGNTLFCDRESLGDLSYRERRQLAQMAEGERAEAERSLLRRNLANLVGTSRKKDTSHDYEQAMAAFRSGNGSQHWLSALKADLARRWAEVQVKLAAIIGRSETAQTEAVKEPTRVATGKDLDRDQEFDREQ